MKNHFSSSFSPLPSLLTLFQGFFVGGGVVRFLVLLRHAPHVGCYFISTERTSHKKIHHTPICLIGGAWARSRPVLEPQSSLCTPILQSAVT